MTGYYFVAIHRSRIRYYRSDRKSRSWFQMWLRRFRTGTSYVKQVANEYNSLAEMRLSLGTAFCHGFNAEREALGIQLTLQDYVKYNPLHNPDYFYGYVWFRGDIEDE